jgi:RNA polymerase sigma-70 factor (ECF subfamily)
MVKDTGYIYLVLQAKSGHRKSLEELAVMVQQKIQPYLCRYISDDDICEDLLQEVLLAVVSGIKKLEQAESFWTWVYSIAWAKIQQHFRDKNKRKSLRFGSAGESFKLKCLQDERSILQDFIDKEESHLVCQVIGKLRKEYREVIRLRCFESLPYLAVASRMQCSYGQSRLYFIRARECLRERLAGMAAG